MPLFIFSWEFHCRQEHDRMFQLGFYFCFSIKNLFSFVLKKIRIANLQSCLRIFLIVFCFVRYLMVFHLLNLFNDLETDFDLSLWNSLYHSSCLGFIKMQDKPNWAFNRNLSFMALQNWFVVLMAPLKFQYLFILKHHL